MPVNLELLRSLTQTPGIAGQEDAIRSLVWREMKTLVTELQVDVLGNVIGHKGDADAPSIAIAAHIDEIGFIVRHIDDKGFIRIQRVGGFDPRVLVAQRVTVHCNSGEQLRGVLQPAAKPVHLQGGASQSDLKLEDFFVDLGMEVEGVKDLVQIGDMITLERDLQQVGDTVVSKALDDRLGVYVMLEAVRKAKAANVHIIPIATVQEEVGLRGAQTAAYGVEADVAIALDVTIAGDVPGGSPDAAVTTLGGGAAIKLYDGSQIANRKVVQHLKELAKEFGIPHQLEVLPAGGTDAGAFQRVRSGMATCTISIPTRYVHTVNEMASLSDIQACVDLLAAFIDAVGSRSYAWEIE